MMGKKPRKKLRRKNYLQELNHPCRGRDKFYNTIIKMADEEDVEIDEFEMFKARSFGVETEYLELARVDKLRKSVKQRSSLANTTPRAPLSSTEHLEHSNKTALNLRQQSRNSNDFDTSPPMKNVGKHTDPKQAHYTDQKPPSIRNKERLSCVENISSEPILNSSNSTDDDAQVNGNYANNDGTKYSENAGFLAPNNDISLQRSCSYRLQRKPSRDVQCVDKLGSSLAESPETSKLNRQRNLTMPARQKLAGRSERRSSRSKRFGNYNNNNTSNNNSHRSNYGNNKLDAGTNEDRKASLALGYIQQNVMNQLSQAGDKSVLRVRNFSTKDGNIINRGDSIKIKRISAKNNPCLSPLTKQDAPPLYNETDRKSIGSLKTSNDFNNKGSANVSKTSTYGIVHNKSSKEHRPISTSTSHLAGENSQDDAYNDSKRHTNSKKLLRQFQSHDEEPRTSFKTAISSKSAADSFLALATPSSLSSQHRLISELTNEAINEAAKETEEERKTSKNQYKYNKEISREELGFNKNVNNLQGGINNNKNPNPDDDVVYKVVVMGMTGVGKSTLMKQMLTSEYLANNENETEDDSTEKTVSVQIDGEESLLQFTDMPSVVQQGWKKKETSHCPPPPAADAHLVVYSVTNKNSYLYAQSCLQDLRPAKRHNAVILVANKQDLVRNRVIQEEEGKSLAHKKHCKFIEVSALLDHKVDDLLVGTTRQIRLRKSVGVWVKENESREAGLGCFQKAVTDLYNRYIRRRTLAEANSCDDLFTP